MIDIHCHLLPGIDDGPATVEDALALAHALVADGITHVVATPHVYPGRFENRRSSIGDEHAAFAALLQQEGIPLTLSWAGEVRLTPEALDLMLMDELPFLGQVGGYRTMLLELPDGQVPLGAERLVKHLLGAHIRPIVVHPERNRGVMENVERLAPLVELGCFVQLTAGSLVGAFGSRAQAVAIELLDRAWVHAVASDSHNLGGRRPRMQEAHDWLATHRGPAVARELTVLGPAGLCAGNAVVNAPRAAPAPASRPGVAQRSAPPGEPGAWPGRV